MSHPIATLRKQTAALRAAIVACLAEPKPKRVHNVRTTMRRLQAQLELIPLLANAPKIDAQSKRVLKAAKTIRQAAGKVRDLDVHTEHLIELPQTVDTATLAKFLTRKRKRQADKLQRMLHKHGSKLIAALDDLEAALISAPTMQLSASQASQLARQWFARSTSTLNPTDPTQFHDLRKASKLARYIAEAAISPSPSPTALHFNQIQQTSGDWRDWLTLTTFAHKHLDSSSPLLAILKHQRDRAHHTALRLVRSHTRTTKPLRKTRTKT